MTPDDGSKYTMTFAADGALTARIDCNRGQGTWKSSTPGQLALGPLALTRAMCPPQSMDGQIIKHWDAIRSYVMKNGHLFLSLMADGGIYEFQPAPVKSARRLVWLYDRSSGPPHVPDVHHGIAAPWPPGL